MRKEEIEEALEPEIKQMIIDARYSAKVYFESQFNENSKSLYDLNKEEWAKALKSLIAQCEVWMDQLKIYGGKLSTIANRTRKKNNLNSNNNDSQKTLLEFKTVIRKIFLLYEKGDILLQKIRVVTTKDAAPTHYSLLLTVDENSHTIDEILLDIPKMLKVVSTGLKKDQDKVHSVLDFLKKLEFRLNKSTINKVYGEDSTVHMNPINGNPQATQIQQELQEGYSVVSKIYPILDREWRQGHSYESFVKGLINYQDFIAVTSKLTEQKDPSFYSFLPNFITMTKEKGKITIQAREYENNAVLTSQSKAFYQKYKEIFDILQEYETDNIPSIAQEGDEERYLIFSKNGIMQDINSNEENKIEVELKNLINGSADFITGNLIITGISNSITNLNNVLDNLQEGNVEDYLKDIANKNRRTDKAEKILQKKMGEKIAEANQSCVDEILKMWKVK